MDETPAAKPINVLVTDDDRAVRRLVREVLKNDGDIVIVGEASNGQEAVNLVKAHRPDVVVMDIDMPQLNGLQATAKLREYGSASKVLVFSANTGQAAVESAFSNGAVGFVAKHEPSQLGRAIRAVNQGHLFLGP
ncbi:MAG TPA: response regulator transcription factor [Opitutaceae bacterium]|nr:response regulator transcription factor [Opitutaceae bacterium]